MAGWSALPALRQHAHARGVPPNHALLVLRLPQLLQHQGRDGAGEFPRPAPQVDETHVCGKRRNMPKATRAQLTGRGPVNMTAVVGAKDRPSNRVRAQVVAHTDAVTLQGFVDAVAAPGATVDTDEAPAYGACRSPTKPSSIQPPSTCATWRTRTALRASGPR